MSLCLSLSLSVSISLFTFTYPFFFNSYRCWANLLRYPRDFGAENCAVKKENETNIPIGFLAYRVTGSCFCKLHELYTVWHM
jgi:hypothetical protein